MRIDGVTIILVMIKTQQILHAISMTNPLQFLRLLCVVGDALAVVNFHRRTVQIEGIIVRQVAMRGDPFQGVLPIELP